MSLPTQSSDSVIVAGSVALDEVFGQMRLKGFEVSDPTQPIGLLAEDDGTLRSQLVLWDGAAQIRALAELTGEARIALVGLDGTSTLQNWLVEPTGEGHLVLNAYDTADAVQRLRVNPRDELQIDSNGFPVHTDPVDLTTTGDTIIHTVPAGSVDTVEIEFSLHTGPNSDITLYIVQSGGATGTDTQRISGTLRDTDTPVRLGPYHMEAGATVVLTAGTANRISAQPTVWRKTL